MIQYCDAVCNLYTTCTTFVDPAMIIAALTGARKTNFDQIVIAGFSLMAATQVFVTTLLAVKIYYASVSLRQLSRVSTKNLSTYSDLMWMLVESGMW